MVITNRNSYVIKQSDDTIWNFSFDINQGIIYKFFKDNAWSEYYFLTDKA